MLFPTVLATPIQYGDFFDKNASPEEIRSTLKYYTSKAHIAGSVEDKEQADYTLDQFQKFGLDTKIETYYPYLSTPDERKLELVSPKKFTAGLLEDVVPEDETSYDQNVIPTFLGYAADGTLENVPIVYAHFCEPDDFKTLEAHGVSPKGALVMCRYGDMFRGLKVRAAELAGAAGVLIYSDPAEDGYTQGKVYPEGPWRPESAVQRGSTQFINFYAGDPLTPFVAATENATRIDPEDANIAKIPALPISYRDAKPFLEALVGHGADCKKMGSTWVGGLDIPYWTGPAGKANLHLKHKFEIKPVWNVIATIPGSVEPDRAVVFGNHRDAWVYGAVDPNSGSAVLMEVARILGLLLDAGWKPARTLILASWDAEEYGLIGSTEWVEDNVSLLNKTCVAYINVDTGCAGSEFEASANPSLHNLIKHIAKLTDDPAGTSLFEQWFKQSGGEPEIGPLGFGSDFVPFLQHIGIASMDLRFNGPYGVYHSNYDSFHWMDKFGDPGFKYHATLVKFLGKLLLKLVGDETLPFDYYTYVDALRGYTADVQKLLTKNNLKVSLDPIEKAISYFERSIPKQKWLMVQNDQDQEETPLNDLLAFAERQFIDLDGIPGRPWYRHVLYAPGEWSGYQAQIFPAIYEAVEKGQDVAKAVEQVAAAIRKVGDYWQQ
ncbi:hypothetical protein EDD86DRAFT_190724 [Gorgonomyces haynaldii]|nr:hypothetical protein EDD86DRAFT_190724 [Gorgonomyces haynaldii]